MWGVGRGRVGRGVGFDECIEDSGSGRLNLLYFTCLEGSGRVILSCFFVVLRFRGGRIYRILPTMHHTAPTVAPRARWPDLRAAADAAELSWDGMSGARESRGRLC